MINAEITAITRLRPDITALHLKPQGDFSYQAGQYIEIGFGTFAPRPYSIASAPRPGSTIDIYIKDFGPGGASHYAANTLAQGDLVTITGPFGRCVLSDPASGSAAQRPLLLIAGGLGITPLKAIAEQALATEPGRALSLYWGAQTADELFLQDYFTERATESTLFNFVPLTGHPVSPAALELYQQNGGDLTAAEIYLAGPPAMITGTITALLACGVARDHIHYDTHPEAADQPGRGASAMKAGTDSRENAL